MTQTREQVVQLAIKAGFKTTESPNLMSEGEDLVSICNLKEFYTLARSDIEAKVSELEAEVARLSELCDKWNSECDDYREENKLLCQQLAASQEEVERLNESAVSTKQYYEQVFEDGTNRISQISQQLATSHELMAYADKIRKGSL